MSTPDPSWEVRCGDALAALREMPDESVQCCVTSPPYWGLRDYGHDDQIGLEETPEAYVERLVEVFDEVRRVLREDGTLWLNLGDSYAGSGKGPSNNALPATDARPDGGPPDAKRNGAQFAHGQAPKAWIPIPGGLKPKDLVGIPWRVAFALQADGWWLRSAIVWHKPNPMPESVQDRPTSAYEHVFLLSRSERYYYDADAIAEPLATDPSENYPARATITGRGTQGAADARGNDRDKSGGFPPRKKRRSGNGFVGRQGGAEYHAKDGGPGTVEPWVENDAGTRNARNVWTITTRPFPGAHFAVFPPELAKKCIIAGSAPGDTVLDPFAGAGTTGLVALRLRRSFIGIELSEDYAALARRRIRNDAPLFHAGWEITR